jgi:hypothetical protein
MLRYVRTFPTPFEATTGLLVLLLTLMNTACRELKTSRYKYENYSFFLIHEAFLLPLYLSRYRLCWLKDTLTTNFRSSHLFLVIHPKSNLSIVLEGRNI